MKSNGTLTKNGGTISQNGERSNTLVLVSGGPDSATLAKKVKLEHKEVGGTIHALYLRTGHLSDEKEIEAANHIVSEIGGKLEIIDIKDLVVALGSDRILIHSEASIMRFGNAIALSIAIAYAFKIHANRVMIALHKDDADESAEYTQDFLDTIERLAAIGHGNSPKVEAPFLSMRKYEVFQLGVELGVDYSVTWSCIRRGKKHCGLCGACRSRRRAFNVIGIDDPTEYEIEPVALESVAAIAM